MRPTCLAPSPRTRLAALGVSLAALGASLTVSPAAQAAPASLAVPPTAITTLPAIFPAPQSIRLDGPALVPGGAARLRFAKGTDASSVDLVRTLLGQAGMAPARKGTGLDVVIGTADSAPVRIALARIGLAAKAVPDKAEGYLLAVRQTARGPLLVIAGHDGDGLFHGVQSLRQLLADMKRTGAIPQLTIADYPAMPVRGTIEGFYGKPWTMAQRAENIAFLARWKANTYIYSPKDDAYARADWRKPYPAETLDKLAALAAQANRDHVNFVYAISPGPSICYSDPADLATIRRKFAALRARGVRSFYVAFDDIEYTKWNCSADEAKFGAPGQKAAGLAQAYVLNAIEGDIAAAHSGALIMVPTEYYNTTESPYKAALRGALDPRVEVQWTGTDVVPAAISVADAKNATKAFGRKTLLWDNYPVNDYGESAGRLLLAPYDGRQAGLSSELTGEVANPMNQEVASRPAVAGLLAFTWNDAAYDPHAVWRKAASDLAGGDPGTRDALLAFFDTQHLAPTFGRQPWQKQAPRLAARIESLRTALAAGDMAATRRALTRLGKAADTLALAPDRIRAGANPGFVAEARPWLDATAIWGRALRLTVDGLSASLERQTGAAHADFDAAQALATKAAAIKTIPGANRIGGPVKVADGVLDSFIAQAPTLVYLPAQATSGEQGAEG